MCHPGIIKFIMLGVAALTYQDTNINSTIIVKVMILLLDLVMFYGNLTVIIVISTSLEPFSFQFIFTRDCHARMIESLFRVVVLQ